MELISKKELLKETGISYGQLYRWKRQRLIPEEWFIKKSSYTGQETFFPRENMLSRVQEILKSKDTYSLDELARLFAPEKSQIVITAEKVSEMEEIDSELFEFAQKGCEKTEYTLFDAALLAVLSQAVREEPLEKRKQEILQKSISVQGVQAGMETEILIFEASGDVHALFAKETDTIAFDSEITVLYRGSFRKSMDEITLKYNRLWSGLED